MKKFLIAVVFSLLAAIVAVTVLWRDYQSYLESVLDIPDVTVFEVKKGFSFNDVIKELKVNNIPVNAAYLKFYGRHSKLANQIKAGVYELQPGLTPVALLAVITSGRSISHSFTIVEGSNFKQVLESLADTEYLENDLKGLSNGQIIQLLNLEFSHPEGAFLAETYSFERRTTASALLVRAHRMLVDTLNSAWEKKAEGLPYKNAYESLIMASIVEKETARTDERPIIAGVFTRRLDKGMKLQTDPTVIYGMGDRYKGNIRRSDLREATPYNTYVIPALPPTPIAMVGREAINAALNPSEGKALFFVAKGDGSHYFSATLKEHNDAVRRYQLNRKKDYRSSP